MSYIERWFKLFRTADGAVTGFVASTLCGVIPLVLTLAWVFGAFK